jgi:hypothetical protein
MSFQMDKNLLHELAAWLIDEERAARQKIARENEDWDRGYHAFCVNVLNKVRELQTR